MFLWSNLFVLFFKEGTHRFSVLSFLISAPTTGIDSILATYSLSGTLFAIFRPLGAFLSSVLLGCLAHFLGGEKEKIPFYQHNHFRVSPNFKLREFLKYTFFETAQDIGKWLIYVCAIGSIPIAASLIDKGFSPGAALVFLIAGPATNTITLSFVRAKLGRKSFYLYVTSITVIAILLGLLFNFLWFTLGSNLQLIKGGAQTLWSNHSFFEKECLFYNY